MSQKTENGRTMDANQHDGIFKSAHEAIVFAVNFGGQQYAMSPMARLMQLGPIGSGRGLGGLDGAGQAGMVIAELCEIEYFSALSLIARCSSSKSRCVCESPCCSGWRENPVWREAINQLTDYVMPALAGSFSARALRVASVKKNFGDKITIQEIAEDVGVHRDTASDQHAKVVKMLKALESKAWADFTSRLETCGMLIKSEETA